MQNKTEATEAINEFLRPIRERRASITDADIRSILKRGAEEARDRAAETMREVRAAMKWV